MERNASFSFEETTVDAPRSGSATAATAGADAPLPKRWVGFGAVMAACVMDLLDVSVIHVAAPAIREDLGGSYAQLQWLAAGYTLALAVLLLTGGRLGDLFGRKRMLVVGLSGFTAASAVCALAVSPEMLIASRVAQGAFGALMVPQAFGLIRDLFPAHEQAKVWAIFGPIMGLAAVLGPIVGGILTDVVGWRSVFFINLPIGVVALAVALRHLPDVKPAPGQGRLDLRGVALGGTAMLLLVFPLVQGREQDWPAWMVALLVAAVPVVALFARDQVRRNRTGAATLVEPSVLRKRSYASGVLFSVTFHAAMGGIMLFIGVLLQAGLGFSPLEAAIAMAPSGVGAFLGSGFGGALMHKLGRSILQLGLTLMALGLGGYLLVLASTGTALGAWDLAAPNAVFGFGMGMIFVPLFDIVLGDVEDHEVGSATGLLGSMQQLGFATGVALLGTVFFSVSGEQGALTAASAVAAAQVATVVALGLVALALTLSGALPRRAREQQWAADAPAATGELVAAA